MSDVLHEIAREIGGNPAAFVIEIVQFVVLLAIVYVVALGFGHRKGMVANMLTERRQRVAVRVERAAHADEMLAQARDQAAARAAAARRDAATIVREARAAARDSRRDARAAADAEAQSIRARARQVLEEEGAEMGVEMRDRLVGVVAQATRALLNEGLSEQEQRQLIQGIVSAEIDRIDATRERRPGAEVSP
jgi:F0F1-type ATP synthase membrane subunit b/b'